MTFWIWASSFKNPPHPLAEPATDADGDPAWQIKIKDLDAFMAFVGEHSVIVSLPQPGGRYPGPCLEIYDHPRE